MKTINFNNTEVTIDNSLGTQIFSIKFEGWELMWQQDDDIWNKTSPLMFPFTGKLVDSSYTHNGKKYEIKAHGFSNEFPSRELEIIHDGKEEVTYLLSSDEDTKKVYPFDFELRINYKLIDSNKLQISYDVKNTSDETMYYNLGHHPAFSFGGLIEDVVVSFGGRGSVEAISIIDNKVKTNKISDNSEFNLSTDYLDKNNTYLLDKMKGEELVVDFISHGLSFKSDDFENMWLWSPVVKGWDNSFLCLEYSTTLPDHDTENTEISKKKMESLESNTNKKYSYIIEFLK